MAQNSSHNERWLTNFRNRKYFQLTLKRANGAAVNCSTWSGLQHRS